jgi:hypothetical protein
MADGMGTGDEDPLTGWGMSLPGGRDNLLCSEPVSTIVMSPDGNSRITLQLHGRNLGFQN